jgi:hypothetical protein
MPYENSLEALEAVRDVIASHDLPPIKQQKFNGIFNAMEVQIEDDDVNLEAVAYLGKAVLSVARGYQLDTQQVEMALAGVNDSLHK